MSRDLQRLNLGQRRADRRAPKKYRQKTGWERHRWAKVRREIFRVRGERCERCRKEPPEVKVVVHHLHPVSQGGPEFPPMEVWDDPDVGLKALCQPCHRYEHASPEERAWTDWLGMEWGIV